MGRLLRIAVFGLLLAAGLALVGCKDDPDAAQRELELYLATCPDTLNQCVSECNTVHDADNNGRIEGEEEQFNSICTQGCQSRCTQAFWFYLLVDE